ncbi:response regulator transcription factor [Vibrio sp. SCSIO 43137]|uniref:response regulator transcription factor n=1 Tax=Vibrio sp. SCSIO 43137 TaxID=3021011 RepID=UPI0023079331|nr:response regulator transcription factor [Vibrio sp. SCSIO 43137]WCE32103.1 response regulator transcription factor [Vibrio sp. SCSIO 43137]
MKKLLIIEDDIKLGQVLQTSFKNYGFDLLHATHAEQGITLLEQHDIQLVILDVMLPGKTGFDICKELRARNDRYSAIPIIMLTARGDVVDKIIGLEIGTDDYLPKPFDTRELVARINSQLRRNDFYDSADSAVTKGILLSGDLMLDQQKQLATLSQQDLCLTSMEFALLELFMTSPGLLFSRDDLTSSLRGIDSEIYSRAIDTLVSRLRNKIHDIDKPSRYIKTVWGRGYMFIGNITKE